MKSPAKDEKKTNTGKNGSRRIYGAFAKNTLPSTSTQAATF